MGTFLVRISERENTHVLTLLGEDHETRNYVIKRVSISFYSEFLIIRNILKKSFKNQSNEIEIKNEYI